MFLLFLSLHFQMKNDILLLLEGDYSLCCFYRNSSIILITATRAPISKARLMSSRTTLLAFFIIFFIFVKLFKNLFFFLNPFIFLHFLLNIPIFLGGEAAKCPVYFLIVPPTVLKASVLHFFRGGVFNNKFKHFKLCFML